MQLRTKACTTNHTLRSLCAYIYVHIFTLCVYTLHTKWLVPCIIFILWNKEIRTSRRIIWLIVPYTACTDRWVRKLVLQSRATGQEPAVSRLNPVASNIVVHPTTSQDMTSIGKPKAAAIAIEICFTCINTAYYCSCPNTIMHGTFHHRHQSFIP